MKHIDQLAISFITVAVTMLGMCPATFASNGLRTVALSGQPAPGTAAGVTFSSFQFPPSLNDSGHTAFQSFLAGTSVETTNDTGVWTEGGSGQLRLMAREGSPAPGISQNFINFGDNNNSPVINDNGYTAFANRRVRAGPDLGIWIESGGVLSLVARPGEQAPGVPAGNNFGVFVTTGFTGGVPFNNGNDIGFAATLTGGGVAANNDSGIWAGSGSGALSLRAREGDAAPGTSATFGQLTDFGGIVLNDSGRITFRGSLLGAGVTGANDTGLWSDRSGTLQLIARAGNQAPGVPAGALFASPNSAVMNGAGHVGFVASLVGPGVNGTNDDGIWADRGAGLELVVRTGDRAPGTPADVNFFGTYGRPVMNANGDMAFFGMLLGPGIVTANDGGIWSEGGGEGLKLVAREGLQAPGTPSGVTFSLISTLLSSPALNGRGQVAFIAQLSGPGITNANDLGLWAQDVRGQLRLIVREGDMLDVSDDPLNPDLRTVLGFNFENRSGNEDGIGSGFNEFGQIAFLASFTNGSQGLFVSDMVVVPEPVVGALVVMLCAAFSARRQRTR
jgi:hypothetical protein